jgi:urease accessory protein UreF
MQHELGPMLEEILRSSEHIDADDAAQPSPLIDVWQGQHDQLYARLFQS